jgi:hypothetical protein
MWRFDATPRRVAAPFGGATGPLSAAAVAPRECRPPTLPSGHERRLEVVVASGLDAPATARAAVAAWLWRRSPTTCSTMRSCSSPSW